MGDEELAALVMAGSPNAEDLALAGKIVAGDGDAHPAGGR